MHVRIYTQTQLWTLVLLRVAIGWHFLYEGLVKIIQPSWSALPYLMDAAGPLDNFFESIATNPTSLWWAELLNTAGLTAVGLSLITGCLSRWGSLGGIFLLAFYYLSHIPYIGSEYLLPTEGNYLWIDKNMIEMIALAVLYTFPSSQIIGIDRWLEKWFNRKK